MFQDWKKTIDFYVITSKRIEIKIFDQSLL